MSKEPLKYNPNTGRWHHALESQRTGGSTSKRTCAEAYTRELLRKEPKYKPLFEGKAWRDIFKILNITMEGEL